MVAATAGETLITATMFEREVNIPLDGASPGHTDADLKMLLLAAPAVAFKIDHRNVVVDVKYS